MRFLLLSLLVTACGTDTFSSDDAGTDAIASGDGTTTTDATKSEGAPPPFDPSQLGSLVLWVDANDAKTGDASDLVATWPDRQHKYNTKIITGSSTACDGAGIHIGKAGTINNHAIASFCNANLDIGDATSLHLGTTPFFIEAVIAPAPSGSSGDVLFTKTQTGDNNVVPSNLTVLAPNSNGRMQGWLVGNTTAFSQNTLQQEFQYVGFVRTSTGIYVRINGQAASTTTINASDDASYAGSDIGIGGYNFDGGNVHNFFRGELAELVVVTDTGRLAEIEFYFKQKYNL